MKANVGGLDRLLRGVAGAVLLSLYFVGPQTPWGLIGLVPLFTAVFKFCPAYSLIGLNTSCCKTQSASAEASQNCGTGGCGCSGNKPE